MAGAGVFSGLGQGTVVDAAGSLSSPRFEAKGGEQTSGNVDARNRDEPARSCWCSSINTVVCPRLLLMVLSVTPVLYGAVIEAMVKPSLERGMPSPVVGCYRPLAVIQCLHR